MRRNEISESRFCARLPSLTRFRTLSANMREHCLPFLVCGNLHGSVCGSQFDEY